jgi:hypothetical protein
VTPTTLYAGTNGGGVFKSTNAGGSWSPVNTGLTGTGVQALTIDPAAPTTLYAGTSDGGLFKSVDGGGSWSPTAPTSTDVRTLAIDPSAPTTLYAGTAGGGVFKSINAGSAWSIVNTGLTATTVQALAVDPAKPTTVYAGTDGGGVFQLRQLPFPASLAVALSLNAATYRAGDPLVVAVSAANPGPAGFVDVFFGVLFPAAAGPALGCPGGDAVAFIADVFTRIVLSCLSSSPASFPPLLHETAIPANLPPVVVPAFFAVPVPAGLPPGGYTVFLATTPVEAFLDGAIEPGDLGTVATAPFVVVP